MELYSLLRAFADSWMLLALTLFYLGVCVWVFLPGQRAGAKNAAGIPFRNDEPARPEEEGNQDG